MSPVLSRLTVLVTAAGALGVGAPAATAATCTDAGGVSVVVDFRELGGGLQTTCDPSGGGRSAAALLTGNGYPITYAQRQPGFVCRVAGVPTTDPCVNTSPANAYWGLYWSNGTSGSWFYSTLGATSLTVPAGGSVAFAWQGASQGAPGVAPPRYAASPSPSPTKTPSPSPTRTPTKTPTKTPTPAPTKPPTATPTPTPTASVTGSPTASPSAEPSTAAPPSSSKATPAPSSSAPPKRDPKPKEPRSTRPTPSGPTPSASTSPTPTDVTVAEAPDPGDGSGTGSVPLPLVVAALGLLGALVSGAAVLRRRRAA